MTSQALVPGIVGFAPATDYVYLTEIQRAAAGGAPDGLVNSLRLVYVTVDADRFFALDDQGRNDEAEELIAGAMHTLSDAGADFVVVTSNTGSVIAERARHDIPLLDIFETAVGAVVKAGARRAGLLSTRRTLESRRYQDAAGQLGIEIIAPPDDIVTRVNRLIDDEAFRGVQTDASLRLLQETVEWFARHGADAAILGCTDLLLFGPESIGRGVLPIIDSTAAHAAAAAQRVQGGV